ncbi:MAG: EAL domain-containing protein, partial [Candidatus Aminicenantes bacterium]|nr:EAL domain-containing protein [Candidatus Aminicenantes bacterium]
LYLPAEDLIGRKLHDVFPAEQADVFLGHIRSMVETRQPMETEYTIPVGPERRPAAFAAVLRPMAGDRVLLVARDITDKRAAEEAIRKSEEKYRSLYENMLEGVYQTTSDGRILSANPALVRMMGYDSEEELKATLSPDAYVNPKERAEWIERLEREGEVRNFEASLRRKDGTLLAVQENARVARGQEGQVLYYEGTLTDVTERKNLEEQLRLLANRDPLTNLFNRRRFHEQLEMQLRQASRYDLRAALLWLDLDHFKEVNDAYGHKAGDEMLLHIARLLQDQVRQADLLARLGGDEFAVFMPHTDLRMAEAAAARILSEIRSRAFEHEGRNIRLTASIGIALYPEQGVTVDKLLTHADLAMYRAKDEGRDRFSRETASDEHHRMRAARAAWTRLIGEGIDQGRFLLYSQPVIELGSRAAAHHELLLRWTEEGGTVVSAESLLSTLQNSDLIRDIDRWVARRALEVLARLRDAGRETVISLNVSAKTFDDPQWADILSRGLINLDPSRLIIEVSEPSTVSQFPQARHFLAFLKSRGCRCALDDFGSGLTSLQHLKLLDVDFLKIDTSLILGLPDRQDSRQLVRAMVQLAHGLEIRVVAEGVDREESLDLLTEL